MSRIFFLPHFLWEYLLAKILYYPQYILLYKIISPPVSFFYDNFSILQRIFPLIFLFYMLPTIRSAMVPLNIFSECLSQSSFSLSAYFSNNGLPLILPLQSPFRSVYINFPPIFRFSPYKLIVGYWIILSIGIFICSAYLFPFLPKLLLPSLR